MTVFPSMARTARLTAWVTLAALTQAPVAAATKAELKGAAAGTELKAAATTNAPVKAAGVELAPQIELAEGKSTLMHLPYPAARLAVGDARVADIMLINPSEVYLLGKSTGSTNLIIWNKANQATIIDVVVGLDVVGLRQQFEQLFPNEKDIRITVSGGSLILSGTVADSVRASQVATIASTYLLRNSRNGGQRGGSAAAPAPAAPAGGADAAGSGAGAASAAAAAALAANTAAASGADPLSGGGGGQQNTGRVINMLAVAAPQQVMLEVKIAEISKSLVDQLGASIGVAGTRGSWTYTMLSNLLSGNASKIDAFNKNGNFATIDAQKADGLVKVLAEPTVMAISGQEASFLAGGKIFIPVAQDGTSGRVTLEEKEFGIAVKFTPTVLEGGRINLRVAPEVSELNREGIGISATTGSATAILPSFTTRRASTTVQLFDGQSFAIGGLIKNNVTTNIKAFPLLGEVPILGALFRSSDFQSDRTELVFIVTPHLARPLDPQHRLPTDDYVEPNRFDFFLRGKMEGATQPGAAPATGSAATGSPTAGSPAAASSAAGAAGFDVK